MRARWLSYTALLSAMVLWGSSYVAMKKAVGTYDPLVVVFGRMLIGTLLFAPFARRWRRERYRPGDWKELTLMAVFEPVLYFICEGYALRLTSASQAGMVAALLPAMVALGAVFVLKERVHGRTWAGFGLAIAGVMIISLAAEETSASPSPLLGNLLECLAMACATGYMICFKRLSERYTPWFLTAVQSFVGCILFFPALFLPWTELPQHLDPEAALAVLYLGAVVTIAAYGFYNYGMSRIPASQASAFINLIPVFTVIMGYAFLDERLTPLQLGAAALIFGGVFLSQARQAAPVPAGGR